MRKTIQTLLLTAMASAGIAIIAVAPSVAEQKGDRKGWSGKSHYKGHYHYNNSKPTFSELDMDGDGMITMENLADYQQQVFAEVDADKNGTLSKQEIENVIIAKSKDRFTLMSGRMVSKLDADKDGVVSSTELGNYSRWMKNHKDASALDLNSDDQLTVDELSAAIQSQVQYRASKMVNHIISKSDTNSDGVLSVTELGSKHTTSKIISKMDINEDGSVSSEEFGSIMSKMRKGVRHNQWKHHHDKNDRH